MDDVRIRAVGVDDMGLWTHWIRDHLSDNGIGRTPLFQPQPRGAVWLAGERIERFVRGLRAPVGTEGWRRAWIAVDDDGSVLGHVDVFGRREPHTAHRAQLGLGVHRDHRGRGLGRALMTHLITWAREQPQLDWLDLEQLGGNTVAARLYSSLGFREVGRVPAQFRIDGEDVDNVLRTLRLRPPSR